LPAGDGGRRSRREVLSDDADARLVIRENTLGLYRL
jgi:hypothetical protein